MPTYYVVKKRDPGEIFGTIVAALVVIALIVVLAIYIGLIFLMILGFIAAGIGSIYALILYIIALKDNLKTVNTRPNNLKDFYYVWHQLIVATSKDAFRLNLNHSANIASRSRLMRKINPVKYVCLFLSLFIIVLGFACIILIGLFQYFIMIFIILGLAFLFVSMIFISALVSLFISFGYGIKYLSKAYHCYHMHSALAPSTYSHFRNLGSNIGSYWRNFVDTVKDMAADMKSHASQQWANVPRYAIYSPVKYYYVASPIGLYFNIGIVALLFAIYSGFLFIILLFIKVICCIITAIMKH